MARMSHKENLLRAISHDSPSWVPRSDDPGLRGIGYVDNIRIENWTDAWGTRWETTRSDMVPFPRGNPLPSLDRLEDYVVPDPGEQFVLPEEAWALLRAPDRDENLIFGNQTYFLFERAWALMGMEPLMEAFFTHPAELKALLRRIADFNIGIFERYLEGGCDGVSFSEDLGSQRALLISPALWSEFFRPECERIFATVKRAGGLVNFHSCGHVQEIVGDLVEMGVDILNPVQARANDLELVKRASAGKMALLGAIDTQHALMRGTPEDVRREARSVIDILAPGGGYICGPDQGMPFPPDNIAALWDEVDSYGAYD